MVDVRQTLLSVLRSCRTAGLMAAMVLQSAHVMAADMDATVAVGVSSPRAVTSQGVTSPVTTAGVGVAIGMTITPRLSAELAYRDLGQARASYQLPPQLQQQSATALMAVFRQPMGAVEWRAKVGVASVADESRFLLPTVRCTPQRPTCAQVDLSRRGTRPAFGLSLVWPATARWQLAAEFERFAAGSGEHPHWVALGVRRPFR